MEKRIYNPEIWETTEYDDKHVEEVLNDNTDSTWESMYNGTSNNDYGIPEGEIWNRKRKVAKIDY